MRNFLISTDITCDLPTEMLDKYDIHTIGMNYSIDNVEYTSKDSISNHLFVNI